MKDYNVRGDRRLFAIATIVLSGVIGGTSLLRLFGYQVGVHTPIPYTVTLQETFYDPQGNASPGGTTTWAVRSDGSRLLRIASPSHVQRTIELPSRDRVTVMDNLSRKSTLPNAFRDTRDFIRDPSSDCLTSITGTQVGPGEAVTGRESISGYRAVRVSRGDRTSWFALDYGCAEVQTEISPPGKRTLRKMLVSLESGEPGADLFTVKDTYQEGPPSGLAQLPGGTVPLPFQRLDQEYQIHRAGK